MRQRPECFAIYAQTILLQLEGPHLPVIPHAEIRASLRVWNMRIMPVSCCDMRLFEASVPGETKMSAYPATHCRTAKSNAIMNSARATMYDPAAMTLRWQIS